ncbi:MAG: methylenetetrahydrofolate--tRNA-(uracil(54)-C(5))-methyltransferase (FADH(2)-oxidizing) TrmFO [Deltaproteobacteria bacterium]|nr:methylenetetrahydrofolate--tRNA-(uracil(54)-C(5))-methyltransferase (FADH(2)-oxidizing) TrmFO [Deltaproteobacteria bacterium]
MLPVKVIGGGLAGCEAAWQIARRGIPVHLYEMRPLRRSPAHRTGDLGELVCSNSLKSNRVDRAGGLLKAELRLADSLLIRLAEEASIPGGSSLCVDRLEYARLVTESIEKNDGITVFRDEMTSLPPEGPAIIATGPLTSDILAADIEGLLGEGALAFYDAIAPTIESDSIDWEKVFIQDRYGEQGVGSYVNCPLRKGDYLNLVEALRTGATVLPHHFEEENLFEACLPVEVLASRGDRTLAFGPMRPVGLSDPMTGRRPYAVVQLRPENRGKTLFGMVGFQTKLRQSEQERIFRMIPGLERAVFERLGSIHRNTFINAPALLDQFQRASSAPWLSFAGQITGVEGYVESIASGAMSGIYTAWKIFGGTPSPPPVTTMIGALLGRLSFSPRGGFQPVNAQFGLLPPIDGPPLGKAARKEAFAERALEHMRAYLSDVPSC